MGDCRVSLRFGFAGAADPEAVVCVVQGIDRAVRGSSHIDGKTADLEPGHNFPGAWRWINHTDRALAAFRHPKGFAIIGKVLGPFANRDQFRVEGDFSCPPGRGVVISAFVSSLLVCVCPAAGKQNVANEKKVTRNAKRKVIHCLPYIAPQQAISFNNFVA